MIPSEIIEKKRDGKNLSQNEIKWFIEGLVNNRIDNSQLSALLMAIYFRGMNDEEMFALVESMVESGYKFDFSHLDSYIADKHSTGGVGDKVSLILAPVLAPVFSTIFCPIKSRAVVEKKIAWQSILISY